MASTEGLSKQLDERLEDLLQTVKNLRPDADFDRLRKAYMAAHSAHLGQTRRSGEPFVTHPIEVAQITAELHMDDDTIVAALLHDAIEDTPVSAEQIEKEFGADVRAMVEGVTKLKLNLPSQASDRQKRLAETRRAAETMRKMLLAMAKDVRVMVIKLADRLHNMRTLESLSPERRTRIANETLDVYAPLAARLGIWQIKWQLEDMAFRTLHPAEFKQISEMVAKSRKQRDSELDEAISILRERLDARGLHDAKIMGRSKHLFSIFNKHVRQNVPFEEIYDLTALRILLEKTEDCYLALGIVHDLWHPMPGLFYDYIGLPKPNGYQSLHTKVIGPHGSALEVQIRTAHMHSVAEYGVAAHWSYKEDRTLKHAPEQMSTLRKQLFDWSSDSRTSSDFFRTVSSDLFSEQVFVFTPKGDVIDLPAGATPVDFAFRVHTDVGLRTVGARVNGVMMSLESELQNGDVVELITRSNAQPSLDWLKFVKSAHARSRIKSFLRKRSKAESAQRGREAVEKELRRQGLDAKEYLSAERINEIAQKMRQVVTPDDVFSRVGEGLTSVMSVVQRLKKLVEPKTLEKPALTVSPEQNVEPTVIAGILDNVMFRRGKCCQPVPGDDAAGYVTRGRGIMIHRRVCPNFLRFVETEPERITPVSWSAASEAAFPVTLRIVSVDRDGLLNDITTILAEAKAHVVGAKVKTLRTNTAEIDFIIKVRDVSHLRHVMSKIGHLSDVLSILRVFGR